MRTLLFILTLAISLPLTLTAQNTLLLEETNLSGSAGSTQTFDFTVTNDELQVSFSVSYGNVNLAVTPRDETSDNGSLPTEYGANGSLNVPFIAAGNYKATLTAQTSYYGVSFDIADIGTTNVSSFFNQETALTNGVYYLLFSSGNPFGYYSFLSDPHYIYHFDLGYEYCFDAADGNNGVYLYDFASNDFFYTSPSFPFPYLYDFNLKSVLYYYPDTSSIGHYTTSPRYFYNYATGQIISK